MTIKVVIHIGPPKTGTSAIQYCLQHDRPRLAKNGIYYPKHTTDVNGISSGNLNNIYDVTNSGRFLNKSKVNKLINLCEKLGMNTLLLSSEFFFENMNEVSSAFPDAKFIAYIRNPLDSFESLYNQSVKRHHKVDLIKGPPKLPKFYLKKLETIVDTIGESHFILRAYSKSAFVGGSIIDDFYSVLNIPAPAYTSKNINPSYSFEALEFKRWINQFCSHSVALRADKVLQSFEGDSGGFSLIEPKKYALYKDEALSFLNIMKSKYCIFGIEQLLEDVNAKRQKPYRRQKLSEEEFEQVATYLDDEAADVYKSICRALYLSSYRSCYTSEYGQAFIKKYNLCDLSEKHMYKTRVLSFIKRLLGKTAEAGELPVLLSSSDDIGRLRDTLRLSDDVSDLDILRELAFVAEKNHDIGLAYLFMKRAQVLRPNGPLINKKIKLYEQKLDNANIEKSSK
jgi:hypothetical protein